MDNQLNEMIKPFKYVAVVVLIEILFFFTFFTSWFSSYDKNLFKIQMNGTYMNCYYIEKYNQAFFMRTGSSGYNTVEPSVNHIDLEVPMKLDVKEYEVYYKSGRRKSNTNGWYREKDLIYKKVKNSHLKLKIERMNHVIYDGSYQQDISSFLNEKGRYYIHIYSARKDGFLTTIQTHISFNVIVGGGNDER